ncbi:MAG: Coupling protein TraD [Holosporales bacterium]
MAESLIPSGFHGDPFWTNVSRQMVSEVLKHAVAYHEPLSSAFEILMTKDFQKSKEFFKGTSISAIFSKEMEKTALSVRTTLATYIRSFFILKDQMHGFSVDRWVKNPDQKGILFIHGVPKQRAQLRPLWSVWFNIGIKAIMDLPSDPNRRIWYIVDELASLNKLPCLDMALAEGRKYGACLVLGFQNFAQMQSLYGRDGATSMKELMVNKFMFQSVDYENAKMLSHMFGMREYIESHENVSYGANEIRDGVSLSHNKRMAPLVTPDDLMRLKPLQFYAMIADQRICLHDTFSYYEAKATHPQFCQANQSTTIGDVLFKKGAEILTVGEIEKGEELAPSKDCLKSITDYLNASIQFEKKI